MKWTSPFYLLSFSSIFTQAYRGDGTFYGEGGNGANGACMLPPGTNGVHTTVAMNQAQFDGGSVCGKCVLLRGWGEGSGMTPIIGPYCAIIDNLCPECKHGDIDMGLGGDGRWTIEWDFVSCWDCPENRNYKKNLRG